MKRAIRIRTRRLPSGPMLPVIFCAICLLLPAGPARGQKSSLARAQFDRAEQMRAILESEAPARRTLQEYKNLVAAYRRVYLITPQAEDATRALMAMGQLYTEMGSRSDPLFYQSAIGTYDFMIREYPGSHYQADAVFAIAQVQHDGLQQPDQAQTAFEEFVRQYPHSPKVPAAREALRQIAEERDYPRPAPIVPVRAAAANRPSAPPEAARELVRVSNIRTRHASGSTRVVADLDGPVQYHSERIKNPDRVFFDLSEAHLSPALLGKTFEVAAGAFKSLRVAQYQKGVVRLVLDFDGVSDYSARMLSNPYRLVIDVPDAIETASASHTALAAMPGGNDPDISDATPGDATPLRVARSSAPMDPAEAPSSRLPAPDSDPGLLRSPSRGKRVSPAPLAPPTLPTRTRDGQRSLTRTLGLKINRIVIDAGHGGHDTGTIGPHGLLEKDLCLDVALRLGRMIQSRVPGAEVIYTRKDDTFVPLEERTAIANQAKADLFVSIHANSSPDESARGVETYYLNFATSEDAMQVAARENATAQSSVHDLKDILAKIARNEKIGESREFAQDVQQSLTKRLQRTSMAEKNRGVKKAPFVVLVGASMPSILSEISFISNPSDEHLLRKPDQRQRVAEGLYFGVHNYLQNLNSLSYNPQRTGVAPD